MCGQLVTVVVAVVLAGAQDLKVLVHRTFSSLYREQ
uniref:Uncharacterized protein n=1 Tax=Arundo donax TaxID=35708 RepID=A0A0A9BBJ9_ARUDO